jgi:hypothetical protein
MNMIHDICKEKIADIETMQKQIEALPHDQQMYIAGVIMGFSLENANQQPAPAQ